VHSNLPLTYINKLFWVSLGGRLRLMFCIIIPSSSAGSPRLAPNAGPTQFRFDGRYGGLVFPGYTGVLVAAGGVATFAVGVLVMTCCYAK
jgi:hypothetical protein